VSATAEELRGNLRVVAAQKRTKMAGDMVRPPADLAGVLTALNDTLAALSSRLNTPSAPSVPSGPVEFVVTEYDESGRVKTFKEGDVEFNVTQRDTGGRVITFKVAKVA